MTSVADKDMVERFAGIPKTTIENTETLRFSEQQKKILLWMLETEEQDASLDAREKDHDGRFYANNIPWSSKKFFGSEPSKNQSSALSRSLSSLEKRELIVLQDSRDEEGSRRRRTTHVAFTEWGRLVAENLKAGYVVRRVSKTTTYNLLEADTTNRWTALGYAIQTLRKEKRQVEAALEIDTEDAYRELRIRDPRVEGELTVDPKNIRSYFLGVSRAIETIKPEYDELDTKIRDAFLLIGAVEVE